MKAAKGIAAGKHTITLENPLKIIEQREEGHLREHYNLCIKPVKLASNWARSEFYQSDSSLEGDKRETLHI